MDIFSDVSLLAFGRSTGVLPVVAGELSMIVENLVNHQHLIDVIAQWHFDAFGRLSGADSRESYRSLLYSYATDENVPATFLAFESDQLVGSASLLTSDLPPRTELTPWLGQLYVQPTWRGRGVGSALVKRVSSEAANQGFDRVYLYTSGTLPDYYRRFGWRFLETLVFDGKHRTVMERATAC